MNKPLTVEQLIKELSLYPKEALVEMDILTIIKTKIGKDDKITNNNFIEDVFINGKVYGVDGWIGRADKVVRITGG